MIRYLVILCTGLAFSYELTVIQKVSNSKSTFITRNGKENNIVSGVKHTFTANNVSIIAKAETVTREYTQWRVLNSQTTLPFNKGETVTMYEATEYLWTLNPEVIRQQYLQSKVFKPKRSFVFSSSIVKGLSEAVSGVPDEQTTRGGLLIETLYEGQFSKSFGYGMGIRYARENIATSAATLETQRLLALLEARYQFDPIENLGGARFAMALCIGFGESSTSLPGSIAAGYATLLPATKFSFSYPFQRNMDLIVEAAYESLRIEEEITQELNQVTNLDNMRFGLGLRRYF